MIEIDVGLLVAYPMLFGYGSWCCLALDWVIWRFVWIICHYLIVDNCAANPSLCLRFLGLSITSRVYYTIIYECEYLGHMWTLANRMWTADHRYKFEPVYTAYNYEPIYDCWPSNGFFRFNRANHPKQLQCFCMTIVLLYCVDWIYVILLFVIIRVLLSYDHYLLLVSLILHFVYKLCFRAWCLPCLLVHRYRPLPCWGDGWASNVLRVWVS